MRGLRWTASLWPGFGRAWADGRWHGLAWAVAFSVALNGALLATLGRGEVLGFSPSPPAAIVAWLLVLSLWAIGIWRERSGAQVIAAAVEPAQQAELEAVFTEAQQEYLRGHWLEAELLVARLLNGNPRDVEARLLLASIQRRTQRMSQAMATLRRLAAGDDATKWLPEIEVELNQIEQLAAETNVADTNELVRETVEKRAA
jgi:hypothetical protein